MFVRTKSVEQNGRTYQYAQLVESYRNDEGKPRQRVVASLGRLTDIEVENLRIALKAGKDGEAVVPVLDAGETPVVGRSLDYLPIAVVFEVAKRIGLTTMLQELCDAPRTEAPISSVVLALIAHRLVAPSSKLGAVRWFERTAVARLLEVESGQLNNSRLHRALNALDEVRPQLQLNVAQLFRSSTVEDRVLFMDVSDTWFEGCGPELAQRSKTKEGLYKKKIGIALTVNKAGQPLRWQVVEGRRHDSPTMKEMARQLQQIPWMQDLPIVFDRAMGKPKHLQELIDANVRFVTMLTSESMAGYASEQLKLPDLLNVTASGPDDDQAQATALHLINQAGFRAVGRRLWVKDLGTRRHRKASTSKATVHPRGFAKRSARAAEAVGLAEELTLRKEQSNAPYLEVGTSMGISLGKTRHARKLMKLVPELRDVIRDGRCSASLNQLEKIAVLEPHKQLDAFALYELPPPCVTDNAAPKHGVSGPLLKLFLVFDPVAFVNARASALGRDAEISGAQGRLNDQIALGSKSVAAAAKELGKLLTKYSVLDCYAVHPMQHSVSVQRDEKAWSRKRRTDGMRLFALHPDLDLTAEDAVELYSMKNTVEVDFRLIKSVLHVRPVHHQTDRKVRSHVDICVLALAIERALNDALPPSLSAAMALEELASVRLVDVAPNAQAKRRFALTGTTTSQRDIINHLKMSGLLEL